MQELEVFRSPEGRHRTSTYSVEGKQCLCIAEPTKRGVLITQFSDSGEILNQVYSKGGKVDSLLYAYLGSAFNPKVIEVDSYSRIALKVHCTNCKGRVVRELDLKKPEEIDDVPVIPIFSCESCRKRYYHISDRYLRHLVEGNPDMFEKDELAEKEKDNDAFINTLKEYIVRVFASKKISRLVIE